MTRTAQDEKGRIDPYQDKLTKDVAATVYLGELLPAPYRTVTRVSNHPSASRR